MFHVLLAYLDYNSTTPVDGRVVEAMLPVLTQRFGNPSSTHDSGMDAADIVDDAREDVAILLGANMGDVVFTSGATEANNMVMSGLALDTDSHHRVLYGATEHKSVIEPCRFLGRLDLEALPVPVRENGVINTNALKGMLEEAPTELVSVMMANSETGVINPIKEISKIVHDAGALLHSDITQAAGKIPVRTHYMGIDIATCSSHKMYGPKGCGAIIATRQVRKKLVPAMHGGGQERNLRSGTQNVPGIAGFAAACQIAYETLHKESARQMVLRDNFESRISSEIPDVTINGGNAERLPNTSSIRIRGAIADAVIANAKNVEISAGSACSSSVMEPSHVLLAMGLDRTAADESVRVSIGRQTDMEDIKLAVSEIAQAAEFVRRTESEIAEGMR